MTDELNPLRDMNRHLSIFIQVHAHVHIHMHNLQDMELSEMIICLQIFHLQTKGYG